MKHSFPFFCLLASALLTARGGVPPRVFHAQGEFAGEPTATGILLQSRLTATEGLVDGDMPGSPGVACFEWSDAADFAAAKRTPWQDAKRETDYIIRARLDGLRPGRTYHYRLIFGPSRDDEQPGPARSFRTLPGSDADGVFTFLMGNCMNYHPFMSGKSNGGGPITATEEDRKLGYPSFAAMRPLAADLYISAGDTVYYDQPRETAAKTEPAMRRKFHEQFRFPRLVDFFAQTPACWLKDDHDFRFDDADKTTGAEPSADLGIRIFREQMPILPQGDLASPTYRTHRITRNLQLWLTEGRDYRSPNRADDTPEKSIWGREQREWLEKSLLESDATWKIIVTPTPMVGPDDARKHDNQADEGGFRSEGEAFFGWLKEHAIRNVVILCGDRHWQYHSIHPTGVSEFSCGAINDENSRRGVKPGAKNSSDPECRIRQPWTYDEPTGGFIRVTVAPAGFQIDFHDDHGKILHSETLTP